MDLFSLRPAVRHLFSGYIIKSHLGMNLYGRQTVESCSCSAENETGWQEVEEKRSSNREMGPLREWRI